MVVQIACEIKQLEGYGSDPSASSRNIMRMHTEQTMDCKSKSAVLSIGRLSTSQSAPTKGWALLREMRHKPSSQPSSQHIHSCNS